MAVRVPFQPPGTLSCDLASVGALWSITMVGTGRHVQKIQQALVDEGLPFRQHGVDGQYGPETADAVGQVQAGSADSIRQRTNKPRWKAQLSFGPYLARPALEQYQFHDHANHDAPLRLD